MSDFEIKYVNHDGVKCYVALSDEVDTVRVARYLAFLHGEVVVRIRKTVYTMNRRGEQEQIFGKGNNNEEVPKRNKTKQ